MAKPAVLHLSPTPEALRSAVEQKFEYCPLYEQKDVQAFLKEKGHSIRAVVTSEDSCVWVDRELVDKLPNLGIVLAYNAEVEKSKIDARHCKFVGVKVANIRGNAVAEEKEACVALELLLAISGEITCAGRYVRRSRWPTPADYPTPFQMTNKRVGIIGLGRIGTAIARRLEPFGGCIAYWSRAQKPEFPSYCYFGSVVDLARHCDILIATCSLTKETTKIINREVLDALGPLGFVVNIARGQVIDEAELVKALVEGRIAGAGLDVFEDEPKVPKELFNLDTVVLQPHVGSATIDTRQSMADMVVANLEAHFSGKPLVTPVH